MRKIMKSRVAAVVLAVVSVAAVAWGIAPASAHDSGAYSSNFVDGGGVLTNDFGENYRDIGNSLCNGCADSWNTDTVVMWQAILAAEGLLSHSGIDGKFGPGTARATKKWQTRYYLNADGKVGPKTWAKADERLRWSSKGYQVRYLGWAGAGVVYFWRGSGTYGSGAYELDNVWTSGVEDTKFRNSHHIYHFKRTITVGWS